MPPVSGKKYTIDELRSIVAPIAEKHGINKVYIFGSVARGNHDEFSDYDFCIDQRKGRGLIELSGIIQDLKDAVGCDIDLSELEMMGPDLRKNFLSERIILYGIDELPPKETTFPEENKKSINKRNNSIFTIKRILEQCEKLNECVALFGGDEKTFRSDKIHQRSCAFLILLIGDIVNSHLPGLTFKHPRIQWKEIAKFSEVIDCDDIEEKADFIWDAITGTVPELKASCERILEEASSSK